MRNQAGMILLLKILIDLCQQEEFQDADLMGNYFRSKKIKLDIVFQAPPRELEKH